MCYKMIENRSTQHSKINHQINSPSDGGVMKAQGGLSLLQFKNEGKGSRKEKTGTCFPTDCELFKIQGLEPEMSKSPTE